MSHHLSKERLSGALFLIRKTYDISRQPAPGTLPGRKQVFREGGSISIPRISFSAAQRTESVCTRRRALEHQKMTQGSFQRQNRLLARFYSRIFRFRIRRDCWSQKSSLSGGRQNPAAAAPGTPV